MEVKRKSRKALGRAGGTSTLLVIALVACTHATPPAPSTAMQLAAPRGYPTGEDAAVFRAALDAVFADSPKIIVLVDSTISLQSPPAVARAEWRERARMKLVAVDSAAVEDYLRANSTRVGIDPSFGYRVPIRLMGDSVRKAFEMRGKILVDAAQKNHSSTVDVMMPFWTGFYDAFPGAHGYGAFSKPGFNRAHTRAVMEYGQGCGSLCLESGFLILEKKSGAWQADKIVEIVS